MAAPVLTYNGKVITFPHKPMSIDLDFGPPAIRTVSLTGARDTSTIPRIDSRLRMRWPIIDDVDLRVELENAMQAIRRGTYAVFALDSDHTVDTSLAVAAALGDDTLWIDNPTGIDVGATYRIMDGPNAQKVTVASVNADKITIHGSLDFDAGVGAIFRDEFLVPLALAENASSFIQVLNTDDGQIPGEWPLSRFIFAPEFLEDFSQEVAVLIKNLTANVTGTDVATAQPWFPSQGGITLASDSAYFFEGYLRLSRAAGTNSHTTSILFGGTAVLESITGKSFCNTGDTVANIAENGLSFEVATAVVVKAASTSATEQTAIKVSGTVRVTTTGTLIPQFQYSSAPGGVPTILKNSFFLLTPLGSASFLSQGTWS